MALDPRVLGLGPSGTDVLTRCASPLRLAAAQSDPVVDAETMRRVDAGAVVVPGAGHTVHGGRPGEVVTLLS